MSRPPNTVRVPPRERNLFVNLFRAFLWIYHTVFHGCRWRHAARVPMSGPVILAPSHASWYDPPIVAVPLWRRAYYFTSAKYFKFPLGPIIRYLNAFPVDLAKRFDLRAYEQALAVLNAGGMLVLFPEGTRTYDGRLGKIQGGVAALALETGATIVPVSILGAFEAWPRTRKLPRWCRPISIKYHVPIPVERTTDPQLKRRRIAEISRQLERVLAPPLRAWNDLQRRRRRLRGMG
ncbi:MAG: 1-acyl-sn-glycerol-3-phosphate acyltransferase [Candidatus Sumerlaeia bacterium]|nr:1-acyl-sn-glycerol-3-phosphate acyltransferase [Candidatus Sumerlaeia bacterium]